MLRVCLSVAMLWQSSTLTMAQPEGLLFRRNLYRVDSCTKETFESICQQESSHINKERFGKTPLSLAIETINRDAVEILIRYGADVNQLFGSESKKTPLIYAIRLGSLEIVKILLVSGANPNQATADFHPLFSTLCNHFFKKEYVPILGLLLRSGSNPLSAYHNTMSIYDHITKGIVTIKGFAQMAQYLQTDATSDTTAALYKKAGRALVQYKILWNHLHRNWCLPKEITKHILTFVDFGLDDYHTPMTKCSICYDEKKFRAIPCSENTHSDSICSDCIGKLTDCPLCRKPLKKNS